MQYSLNIFDYLDILIFLIFFLLQNYSINASNNLYYFALLKVKKIQHDIKVVKWKPHKFIRLENNCYILLIKLGSDNKFFVVHTRLNIGCQSMAANA